ncbi:MAG: ATP-binding cassette domain-containing protein [Tannerella sp.]|jgi:ABC-2 type transport system ATP-binding protein|nr:ATP-binding cassette domain-containing protein [Tannerella sp.]
MIRVEKISFKYKRKTVFTDFNLTVAEGKVYGLLGKNGAGKSTLLYLMTGLLKARKGKLFYNDIDVSKRKPATLNDVFIVPEEFMLPSISLREYLSINSPFYPRFSSEQLKQNLSHFDLEADHNINLGSLSMGQKKKVFMSFALSTNTSLLIMDEPTNGLDIPGKSQFKKFIASNMTDERTIIISTHQVRDIEKLIEHVIILDNSDILLDASTADICSRLYFAEGVDHYDPDKALYAVPSLTGFNVITTNDNEAETVLNLETLFNATLSNTGSIKAMFNSKNTSL